MINVQGRTVWTKSETQLRELVNTFLLDKFITQFDIKLINVGGNPAIAGLIYALDTVVTQEEYATDTSGAFYALNSFTYLYFVQFSYNGTVISKSVSELSDITDLTYDDISSYNTFSSNNNLYINMESSYYDTLWNANTDRYFIKGTSTGWEVLSNSFGSEPTEELRDMVILDNLIYEVVFSNDYYQYYIQCRDFTGSLIWYEALDCDGLFESCPVDYNENYIDYYDASSLDIYELQNNSLGVNIKTYSNTNYGTGSSITMAEFSNSGQLNNSYLFQAGPNEYYQLGRGNTSATRLITCGNYGTQATQSNVPAVYLVSKFGSKSINKFLNLEQGSSIIGAKEIDDNKLLALIYKYRDGDNWSNFEAVVTTLNIEEE